MTTALASGRSMLTFVLLLLQLSGTVGIPVQASTTAPVGASGVAGAFVGHDAPLDPPTRACAPSYAIAEPHAVVLSTGWTSSVQS